MPEARDRLSRQDDVMSAYINRRRSVSGGNRNSEVIIMDDEVADQATATPFRWRGAAMVSTPGPMGVARRSNASRTPTFRRSPNFGGSSALAIGRRNISPAVGSARVRGGFRARGNTTLSAWYPRTPLRDITAVVRAIERTRARRGQGEGLETESPTLQDQKDHDPSESTSVAQLERDLSLTTPLPKIEGRRCPPTIGKVPKILLDITNRSNEPACLTPQKKLLNNIETAEKVVMQELQKLKRTPTAKKAERQKRVRTLMSMR